MSEYIADKLYELGLSAKKALVASTNVNKPIDQEKVNDMKHNSLEVFVDNSRQRNVRVSSKEKLKRQRQYMYLGQE
jgi:hypothetical protein